MNDLLYLAETVLDGLYEAIKNYLARLSTESLDREELRTRIEALGRGEGKVEGDSRAGR